MSTAAERTLTVALLGNPNTGKSTLFMALAGVRQRVGNYPGVTVEKKIGHARFGGRSFALVDLPGTYSLAPRSPDEMVTVDVLLGRRRDVSPPDVVLCIVDANNLERNLYLVSQALELGLPTVVALNMIDVAERNGASIDAEMLAQSLGVPVVPVQAHRRIGIEKLKQALAAAVDRQVSTRRPSPFPDAFVREVARLEHTLRDGGNGPPRFLVERLILDTNGYIEQEVLAGRPAAMRQRLEESRQRLAACGMPVPAVEAVSRYAWVGRMLEGVVRRRPPTGAPLTDRIDRVLTHWLAGPILFALLMIVMFQAVFSWATLGMEAIDAAKEAVADWVSARMEDTPLRSLVTSGVIEGVGAVLMFLPQILTLFLFIALLEDCGYMARAAYLMDRLMTPIGLSGKSFIPLLSSFACAIPGVMAARVIENRRDRLVTILVAPLMSCSARLPVYTLLITAFIPDVPAFGLAVAHPWGELRLALQGVVLFGMYLAGILAAVVVALALRRTILRGETPPFVMELPVYKVPSPRVVLARVFERGWAFVRRAGTLIFAVMVVVWGAAYYPHDPRAIDPLLLQRKHDLAERVALVEEAADAAAPLEALRAELADVDRRIEGGYLRDSFLGRAGRLVEPLVRPLGWDWRIGCAAIASFPAREVVVGTLGVIYDLGQGADEKSESLRARLQAATWDGTDRPVFNVPVALSLMVFFSLCAQCAATLAVIKRETNSWLWPAFTFTYMTTLAYLGALATYQVGMLFT